MSRQKAPAVICSASSPEHLPRASERDLPAERADNAGIAPVLNAGLHELEGGSAERADLRQSAVKRPRKRTGEGATARPTGEEIPVVDLIVCVRWNCVRLRSFTEDTTPARTKEASIAAPPDAYGTRRSVSSA